MLPSSDKKATSRVYSRVRIGLASPEVILDWSYGEVLKPETINYRSLKPEKDGLFCEKIFGTTKDWECGCGKFKSIRYKGIICDRCGVEITHSKVRRERMGHIKLSVPVAHIWFYKSVPSRIGLLLDLSIFAVKSIIYCEQYLVLDPGEVKDIKKHELITEDRYYELREEHGKKFRAGTGAEVIQEMLEELDLDGEAIQLRDKMNASGKTLDKRKMVRLGLIEDFIDSSNRPEWMVLQVVPVIPADLRPMVQLEGGRFATSDLNDLYRRLINRNNRLKKLMALKAPDVIIKNEKRMLQEAVDALFDNSKRKRAFKGVGNRTLKSLSDILKGKQGRFRQNLLGKRVDYSARSVIVVGPELKLYQCGLPRKMALELFKPFIMRRMVERKYVYNIKSAKRLIDNEYPEVWNLLEETVKGHPVILNRAPTLHRLGMQAFEPVLTNEKAIRLHPLVCSAYNADFDGDQMAVHIPLSAEAQIEAWTLMLSSLNLLDPANGEPVMNPSQDMILGYYNLTSYKEGERGEGKYFGSTTEAKKAYENGVVSLQAKIRVAYPSKRATSNPEAKSAKKPQAGKAGKAKINNFSSLRVMKETSVGRIIFSEVLPEGIEIPDKALVDRDVLALIKKTHEKYGNYTTAEMLDQLKQIGFHYSTLFSNTISLEDILIPAQKTSIIASTHQQANLNNQNYQKGIITEQERYQKNISLWTYANDVITQHMMEQLSRDQKGHNSLYIMASSGARGSKQQIRQLAGMRGLMAKPSGDIIDMPIISNFKEGLQVLEYFISTHGARKGLSDTALKTADAGYLTRKLVDTAQDVTVVMDDCGTISGIDISPIKSGGEVIERLSERVLGRFSAEAIIDPFTDTVILEADQEITPKVAELVDKAEMSKVKIRTVVTCEAPLGICRRCYGINLAQSKMVDIGEAVGVVASQSIGQPGTQLTMRTFHVGGTASSEVKDPDFKATSNLMIVKLPEILLHNQEKQLVAPRRGFVSLAIVFDKFPRSNFKKIKVENGQRVSINSEIGVTKKGQDITVKKPGFVYFDEKNKLLLHIGIPYQHPVEVGAVFKKGQAEFIQQGEVIYSFDTVTEPIIAEASGTVRFQDIILNKTLREEYDEYTTVINYKIITSKEEHLQPKLIIVSTEKTPGEETPKTIELDLPVDSNLYTKDGEKVFKGDILAGRIRSAQKTVDITGGLPRVQELFEARNPTNAAIIAEIDGEVEIGETRKGRRTIFIKNVFSEKVEHVVPTGKALTVRNGDLVMAGEPLCEGMINPHDVLRVNGEIDLYRFILKSVQEIYKRQGVNINDKHIGVIVRQMLRKVEIVDSGDTSYIVGDLVDKYRLRQKNEEVIKEGGQPAVVKSVLLGLTKASLRTDSFISSAAFQETTKVLATEAIKNSYDELRGLKENVIIGQKIPAGTGKEDYEQLKVYQNFVGDLDYVLMEEEE